MEEVKRRVDPVDYIGRSVRLQRAGRNFRGLCPFHTEKTPSFYVFPDRGTWRCFGSCGEGGDIFTFVQKRDGVEFRDALRELAAEAGVQLSPQAAAQRSRVERLAAVMSAAVDFYQRQLREEGGSAASRYLQEKRGLARETLETFHLGWAPDEWRLLRDYLAGRGYSEADAIAAGLLVEGEHGAHPYDRFRGRVIIPIADERGVFVGLGGRGLHNEEPKYLNSPQTELFDKGRMLFGLHTAAASARELGAIVVVEGYMDVLGPWQAGFANVVATMGTSLTENHAKLLRRFAQRVVLAMDPDSAGTAATERAGALFLAAPADNPGAAARSADAIANAAEIDLRVALLPAGKDPDEVARESPESWRQAIANAQPFPQFLIDRVMGRQAPESPLEARRMVERLRPVLMAVSNPVERGMYIQRVARRLGIAERDVAERLRPPGPRGRRPLAPGAQAPSRPQLTHEEYLLAIVLRHPSLRFHVRGLPPDLFSDAMNREIFQRWASDTGLVPREDDDPVGEKVERIRDIRLPELTAEAARRAASEKIQAILQDRLIQRQATVTADLAEAERTMGPNAVALLSAEAWRGHVPDDETASLAEIVIEELELGLSIHRKEPTGLA